MRDIMGWIMTSARPDILQIPDWVLGRWAGLPRPWGLLGHMRHPYGHRPATSGFYFIFLTQKKRKLECKKQPATSGLRKTTSQAGN